MMTVHIDTHTKVSVIRLQHVSEALHHRAIHLESIHLHKAFPAWTEADRSTATPQIYQFKGRIPTGT